jgi:hypothetical protein
MGVNRATEHEILRVLHTLWVEGHMSTSKVRFLLKDCYDLELTVLTNGKIKAEPKDGKTQYSIG